MYCTLSHMLGHVTSSANGQPYTIKINKYFLMGLLKRSDSSVFIKWICYCSYRSARRGTTTTKSWLGTTTSSHTTTRAPTTIRFIFTSIAYISVCKRIFYTITFPSRTVKKYTNNSLLLSFFASYYQSIRPKFFLFI